MYVLKDLSFLSKLFNIESNNLFELFLLYCTLCAFMALGEKIYKIKIKCELEVYARIAMNRI